MGGGLGGEAGTKRGRGSISTPVSAVVELRPSGRRDRRTLQQWCCVSGAASPDSVTTRCLQPAGAASSSVLLQHCPHVVGKGLGVWEGLGVWRGGGCGRGGGPT